MAMQFDKRRMNFSQMYVEKVYSDYYNNEVLCVYSVWNMERGRVQHGDSCRESNCTLTHK